MEKQRKTFLSYSRVNKDFALRLAKELKAEGFDVWLDQLDIPAGARWDREVERALKDSEIFMIILTPASIDSENVLDEIGYAIDTGKRFLPVLLERCDIPLRLRRFQYVDFTNKDFDDGVESAKALLRGLIGLPTLPRMEISSSSQVQAEEERKAQEEGDRLAAQKVANEQLTQQKAEAEAERKAKAEARRKAKEDREAKAKVDRIAGQKGEEEQLASTEAERKARIGANRKAKEDADHLAAQKAEAERISKETTVAAEIKAEPAVLTQKKPASKLMRYGIGAVVVLAVLGIGFYGLAGRDKNSPAATLTAQAAVVALATEVPATPTRVIPTNTATVAPTPIGGGTGKIAFVSNRNGNDEIYIMNADGSGVTHLTNNSASDSFPGWSPDGKHIVFHSFRDEPNPDTCTNCNNEIYIMNADGSNQIRLTNNQAEDIRPTWSPDGKHIAFQSDRDGNYEIYIMNADGSEQTRLTNNDAYDASPAWSPDGKRIAFHSTRDGKSQIYIMNGDGSGQTRLTNNQTTDSFPVWSPDGRYIIFQSNRDESNLDTCSISCNFEVYIMNADGSQQTRVTNNEAYDGLPTWSVDGMHIVFTSNRDEPNRDACNSSCNEEIYIMNADGSGLTRLTINSAGDSLPVWQP